VEKVSPIIYAASVIFTKATQSEQSDNRRKFAQSGHTVFNKLTCKVTGMRVAFWPLKKFLKIK
jgi:hypothetical protein